MRILKLLNFCFLILISFTNSAQDSLTLPSNWGLTLYPKSSDLISEDYSKLLSYDYDKLTHVAKASYNLRYSILRLYSGRDSSLFYFQKAYRQRPKYVCNIIVPTASYHESRIKDGDIHENYNWFLLDIPDFSETDFINECDSIFFSNKKIIKEVYSNLFEKISRNDHKYRTNKDINWEKQNYLDSINRNIIDSIYISHGSLLKLSQDEINLISLILHHSDECFWNRKWVEYFFKEIVLNNIDAPQFLGIAIDRMYRKGDGFCYKEDAFEVKSLIDSLNSIYPDLTEKFFGNY